MLTRSQKEVEVAELHDRFTRATSVFVAEYRGSRRRQRRRAASEDARRGCRSVRVSRAKNTLLRRAARGLDGRCARRALQRADGGRVLVRRSREAGEDAGRVRARTRSRSSCAPRVVEGQALDTAEIAMLATLPSLDELRGKLIGLLQAPAAQLARLLAAPGAQIARVVGAHQRQLEAAGASE